MAKFNTNRENLVTLDNAFKILKEDNQSNAGKTMLKESSERIFPYTFNINIITNIFEPEKTPLFVMSVYPIKSTIDKIVDAVAKQDTKMISKLWEQTKEWTIEIDSRILNNNFVQLSDRELTAIYCHEIGHIISSNSIPTRITNILQYELAKASMSNKVLIRDKFFQKFLSLPILNACSVHNDKSLKEEIKADKFVKTVGYQSELISVMQKFQKCSKFNKQSNSDKSMKMMATFTTDALNQFKKRETSLLESTLYRMKNECSSVYLENSLDTIIKEYFDDSNTSSVTQEKRLNFFYERAKSLEDEFIATEFFGIGKKALKRIDPAELDYILIKTKTIKTDSDKLMLVSYAHSKLDIVEYYLSLLKNPKDSKKYRIPYSIDELESLKIRLNKMIEDIIEFKLPGKLNGVLVAWPDGYEG